MLLDFALGKKRSFVWLITPDAVRAFGLPPRDTVQQAAAAMQAAMTGPPDPHAPAALGGMLLDQLRPRSKASGSSSSPMRPYRVRFHLPR